MLRRRNRLLQQRPPIPLPSPSPPPHTRLLGGITGTARQTRVSPLAAPPLPPACPLSCSPSNKTISHLRPQSSQCIGLAIVVAVTVAVVFSQPAPPGRLPRLRLPMVGQGGLRTSSYGTHIDQCVWEGAGGGGGGRGYHAEGVIHIRLGVMTCLCTRTSIADEVR